MNGSSWVTWRWGPVHCAEGTLSSRPAVSKVGAQSCSWEDGEKTPNIFFYLLLLSFKVTISVYISRYVMLGQNAPDAHADICQGVRRWEMLVCSALHANEEGVLDGWGGGVVGGSCQNLFQQGWSR